jgi:hypothetical protein
MLYKASQPHSAALAPLVITSHLISLIKTITPAANLAWHSHPNPLNPIKSPKPLSSPRSAYYSSAAHNHETPPHLQTRHPHRHVWDQLQLHRIRPNRHRRRLQPIAPRSPHGHRPPSARRPGRRLGQIPIRHRPRPDRRTPTSRRHLRRANRQKAATKKSPPPSTTQTPPTTPCPASTTCATSAFSARNHHR